MVDVVLQGPGKNALSLDVMQRALDGIRGAKGEPLLLTGAGDAFSAGLNLKELAVLDGAGLERFLQTLDDLVLALFVHPAPVVAWINGHAIAGGCVLALTADLRVSTSDAKARIGLNETAIGLVLPPRVRKLADARLPRHTRDRVLLEAGLHAPTDALALGLVDAVRDDAEAGAREALGRLSAHPREAYATTKRELREGVLDLTAAEIASFRENVVPRWMARREELVGLLARK